MRLWGLGASLLVSLATCGPSVEPACAPPLPAPVVPSSTTVLEPAPSTTVPAVATVPTMMSTRHPDVQLKATGDGTLRTAVRGEFVAGTRAMRFFSTETFAPPYTFSGRFRVHERLPNGWLRWDGKPITYDPSVVFHPATMPDEPGSSNWNNLVLRAYGEETLGGGIGGISAELYAPEVGDSVYGVRTGYVSRERQAFGPMGTGWHTFAVTVDSAAAYSLTMDGTRVLSVVEQEPSSMFGDRFAVGLRVDGFDIEFDDLTVVEE